MPSYPAGTVTFLFTDIEQSTRGWERDAAAARVVVERHLALIRQAVEAHGGWTTKWSESGISGTAASSSLK
jgi:class 3 adenylate cyclase